MKEQIMKETNKDIIAENMNSLVSNIFLDYFANHPHAKNMMGFGLLALVGMIGLGTEIKEVLG